MGLLGVVVCAAGPAGGVGELVSLAQGRGWDVQVIATPSALDFIDVEALERQTGNPVRWRYRKPGEPRAPLSDAIIVAPATYNTVNKWAHGISDTYALGVLAEAPGMGTPIVVLPFVNSALAGRHAFKQSVSTLRSEGVRFLTGYGERPPRSEGDDHFPWHLALREVERAG
ncbi:flavoprotein [Actinomadura sp. SCN-SB]|uniref:flavoprotein n=1 Tax=Actinomadura sp. SCN-SB TaxID=3373092 RepID=UPI00375156C8